jgi:protein-S-isoprenylcysteine O-methyltransferase Ste14
MAEKGSTAMNEARSQTMVAVTVLLGSFAIILASMFTGRPIPDTVMTLITVSVSAVLGWYFGVRGSAVGAATVNEAHANTVAAVAAAGVVAHDQAVETIRAAEHTEPPRG